MAPSLFNLVPLSFHLFFALAFSTSVSAQPSVLTAKLAGNVKLLAEKLLPWRQLEASYSSRNILLEPINGEELVETAAENIGNHLLSQLGALERIAESSESLSLEHRNDVAFHDHRITTAKTKYSLSADHFHENIDSLLHKPNQSNASAVHIPFEVYEGWMWHRYKTVWWEDMELMNSLEWSANLDATFRRNADVDHKLYRQFFASSKGFLRYYPGHKWSTLNNQPSIYDPRRMHWYSQTISSAKDLIILIDMSGSIHGPSFDIMKITVKSILSSLGENDYFNVAQFSGNITWLVPCFNRLVPATSRNKRLIHQAVDHLHPYGKASYGQALRFAYNQLIQMDRERWPTSGCQRAVMLISDGGTELPEDELKSFTTDPITKNVRVFTLAVSPHPIPTVSLRKIACQSRAYHGAIITVGAIRSKVLDYLKVLSRPVALSRDRKLTHWSLVYKDIGDQGDVVSITKPVYNLTSTNTSSTNQVLLGVAGIDIPVSVFDQFLPDWQLGMGGYKMVTTPTGTVLTHPHLKEHKSYLEDPVMVDLDDIEPINQEHGLRQNLIERNNGKIDYSASLVWDQRYVVTVNKTFYFHPISNSPYSLTVSIWNRARRIVADERQLFKLPLEVNATSLGDVVPAKFCKLTEMNATDFVRLVRKNSTVCHPGELHNILLDMFHTENLWNVTTGITSRFVVTRSGTVRMEKTMAKNKKSVADRNDSINTRSILSRLVSTSASILISPHLEQSQNWRHNRMFLFAAKVTAREEPLAVVGGLISEAAIDSLWEPTETENNCSSNANARCYWIDDGGYIIASNQARDVMGSFLGSRTADPEVMRALTNDPQPLYRHVRVVKASSLCRIHKQGKHESNNAGFSPTFRQMDNLRSIVSSLQNAVLLLLIASLAWFQPASATTTGASMDISLDQLRQPKVDSYVCTKIYDLYEKIDRSDWIKDVTLTCASDNCTRRISARHIAGTNTAFVVADEPCACTVQPLPHGLTEVDEFQNCDTASRYRRNTNKCYAIDPREIPKPCSSTGVTFSPSVQLLMTNMFFFLLAKTISNNQ